jgi:hypothetical protein
VSTFRRITGRLFRSPEPAGERAPTEREGRVRFVGGSQRGAMASCDERDSEVTKSTHLGRTAALQPIERGCGDGLSRRKGFFVSWR